MEIAEEGIDTRPFVAKDMYPGDCVTKYYCLDVTPNGNATMRFYTQSADPGAKLGEVLGVRVFLWSAGADGSYSRTAVLYDGLMRNLSADTTMAVTVTGEKDVLVRYFFEIQVYLDKTVGNEYMNQSFTTDFRWELSK